MSKQHCNIIDRRGTGIGKTTEAIAILNTTLAEGGVVVYVMGSFKSLEEVRPKIPSPNVIIFKGRSHPGMCAVYEEKKHLTKYIHPKFSCYGCSTQLDGCPFKQQLSEIRSLKDWGEGFAILTVPQNLDRVLKELGSKVTLVILDDVPLYKSTMPEKIIEKDTVRSAITWLNPDSILLIVSKMLLDPEKDTKSILKVIRMAENVYTEDLDELQERVEDAIDNGITPPDLRFLFDLERVKTVVANDPAAPFQIRFYSDLTRRLRKCQVRYLNATPSLADYEAMKRLGPYDEISEPSEHHDNWIVLQLTGTKYTQQSLKESEPLIEILDTALSAFKKQLSFINQPLLFMTDGGAIKVRFNSYFAENHPSLEVKMVGFHSSESSGTNTFRNYPISVIIGAPSKPPEAFRHPCFDNLRKATEEIQEDIEKENARRQTAKDNGKWVRYRGVFTVPREVSNSDARSSLIQMIGRTHRIGDDENQIKIVIVITDIGLPLADETGHIPENGARVERIDTIEKLIKRLEELVKGALVPKVLDRIYQEIDISLFYGEKVGLSKVGKDYATLTGVSERRIRDALSNRYETYETTNHQEKKTTLLKPLPLISPHPSIPATLFEKVPNSECLRENEVWPEILSFDLKIPLSHLWNVILADNCS